MAKAETTAQASDPHQEVSAPRLPEWGTFTRELTPAWLAAVARLAGQEPVEPAAPLRYLHLGCDSGRTAAVVAAVQPSAEVWAWDHRPEHLEAASRLGTAAGLGNLAVHRRCRLPQDLGGPADIVVVQEVLRAMDDEQRLQLARSVREVVRPGGLVVVTYPTSAGWSEVAPVQALLRQVALGTAGPPETAVGTVLELVSRLRAGGARYLTARPVVAAWLDHLVTLEPRALVASYLRDPFRPLSPARVGALVGGDGWSYLGSARLTDDLDLGLAPALVERLRNVSHRVVQETYRDLAHRRTHRMDVFRLGCTDPSSEQRAHLLEGLLLTATAPRTATVDLVSTQVWEALVDGPLPAVRLHDDPAEAATLARRLLDDAMVHPVLTDQPTADAQAASRSLAGALGTAAVVPSLGTLAPTPSPEAAWWQPERSE